MDKTILGFFVILLFVIITPLAYAQVSIGEKAVQRSVEVFINTEGEVHVKHTIAPTGTPKQVELINGTASNITVTDSDGQKQLFSMLNDSGVLVMPSNNELVVEYDLGDVLLQKDGVWTWNFRYLETTSFMFPSEVDLIFANKKPVYLGDKQGIACHGCQMTLEYSVNEPTVFKNVIWKNNEFDIELRSHAVLDEIVFDQPSKKITFDVSEENRTITAIIPLKLLWGPYEVFLDDEKIPLNDNINNGTHVWLIMKPDNVGKISIIGTTAIPEFPLVAPLAIGFLMIIVLPMIRKINRH